MSAGTWDAQLRNSGLIVAGVMLALVTCGGCSSGNYRYLPPPGTTVSKEPAVDSSLDAMEQSTVSPLAEQSKRDVDLILQRQKVANQSAGQPASAPIEPSTKPAIVWIDPRKPAAANSAPQAAAPAVGRVDTVTPPPAPAAGPGLGPDEDAYGGGENRSLNPDRLNQLMVDLGRELYASGAYSDTPLRQLLVIAAMSMIDPQRTLDPQAVPDLSEKERELLAKLQAFFAELGRSLEGTNDVEHTIVDAVARLRESIVRPPQLQLPTATLCTRVGGFGDYSAFGRNTFLAHSEQKVIVYLEVNEFTSALNDKGEYVTELSQQLTIYADRDGIPVWKEDWQAAVDVTKNKRRDFFTVQVITLPRALSVGKYHLKVRMRDEKSGAEAETAITLEMVADPKMTDAR
jgi:hypothetical protein